MVNIDTVRLPFGKPVPKRSQPQQRASLRTNLATDIFTRQAMRFQGYSEHPPVTLHGNDQVKTFVHEFLPYMTTTLQSLTLGGRGSEWDHPDYEGWAYVDIEELTPLKALKALYLNGDNMTIKNLEALAKCPNLEALGLKNESVSPEDLVYVLKKLPHLKHLELAAFGDKGKSVENLKRLLPDLPNLEELEYDCGRYPGANLGDTSLAAVGDLKKLRVLKIPFMPVEDLTPLAHLTNLEVLDLTNTRINEINAGSLKALYGLPKLRSLTISDNAVTTQALADLFRQLPSLQEVHLLYDAGLGFARKYANGSSGYLQAEGMVSKLKGMFPHIQFEAVSDGHYVS